MVFWFRMYINNVKLALLLHPELVFLETFIANHMASFMTASCIVRFICLSSQGNTHTRVVTHFIARKISLIFNLTILSLVALNRKCTIIQ